MFEKNQHRLFLSDQKDQIVPSFVDVRTSQSAWWQTHKAAQVSKEESEVVTDA